jgi:hypothetical protein
MLKPHRLRRTRLARVLCCSSQSDVLQCTTDETPDDETIETLVEPGPGFFFRVGFGFFIVRVLKAVIMVLILA